jgi:hypothetical protein
MSTEHQQYSPENQLEVIQQYATAHNMEIVQVYSDPIEYSPKCPVMDALTSLGVPTGPVTPWVVPQEDRLYRQTRISEAIGCLVR